MMPWGSRGTKGAGLTPVIRQLDIERNIGVDAKRMCA
jgi:hypothetical protein